MIRPIGTEKRNQNTTSCSAKNTPDYDKQKCRSETKSESKSVLGIKQEDLLRKHLGKTEHIQNTISHFRSRYTSVSQCQVSKKYLCN